jgi:hypothetical protein
MSIKRLGVSIAVCLAAAPLFADSDASPSFERDVRPILKARCFPCHGEGQKTEGGLDVRLRRFLVKGGDYGPAIVPGKPEQSYLLDRVKAGEMPPDEDAEELSTEDIALIERWIAAGAKTAHPEPEDLSSGMYITEAERQFWSFQPIEKPDVPAVQHADRVRSPIDSFLLARLEERNATYAEEADKQKLLRRAYFDLVGLPPSPEEADAFLQDDSPDAYERLIDRLLDSPHYGERWGRHWLDIAGYADSEGAENDDIRPYAYRYRDYVIRSFNSDKPFDQFIREQLAGDEMVGPLKGDLTSGQAEKLIATGFLQMAPDRTGSAEDRKTAHNQLVADTLKIVSTSLLGLTVGCARCHDHRFDPISQDDYYRFRAIFEPALSRANWQGKKRQVPWITDFDKREAELSYERQKQGVVLRAVEDQLKKLPQEKRETAREAFETPKAARSEEQQQLLVDSKLNITLENVEEFDRRAAQELKRLANRRKAQQQRLGFLQAIQEKAMARTFLFVRGDPNDRGPEVQPGELTILQDEKGPAIPVNDSNLPSSGRRLAYAQHLTDGNHPLVARVIVNRVWMHHFGQGLSRTPADFGMEGDPPSHPELLDWLAAEFMENGWSLKHLHKLIMTSSAYRQGSRRTEELAHIDPDNRLLGCFMLRRLEAEIVRDSILAVSGDLNRKPFGQPVPVMIDPAGEIVIGFESLNAGIPVAVVPMFGEEHRRSVYVQSRRTMPLTFMEMFDAPEMEPNCEARTTSTVAPQSLVLMNSPFILRQSMSFAERVREEAGKDVEQQVKRAWKLAFGREPTDEETADAVSFLKSQTEYFREHPPEIVEQVEVPGSRSQFGGPQVFDLLIEAASAAGPETLALAQLCQMLMSSNEFLYVG